MERDIRLNWEAITLEAKRRRKDRKITQSRLAVLAKVSRSTVVRFEANQDDIQLSSALRILSVLDLVDRKQEGSVFLRTVRAGDTRGEGYIVLFAPYLGPGGAMEPKELANEQALKGFLKELRIDSEASGKALAELGLTENASIPNVLLSLDQLRQHWPTQFSQGLVKPA